MQISHILSDLTSLQVCDPSAALSLVNLSSSSSSTSPSSPSPSPPTNTSASTSADIDIDMQRANDLINLHYGVKVKYAQNQEREDAELKRARDQVDGVVRGLREREGAREKERKGKAKGGGEE